MNNYSVRWFSYRMFHCSYSIDPKSQTLSRNLVLFFFRFLFSKKLTNSRNWLYNRHTADWLFSFGRGNEAKIRAVQKQKKLYRPSWLEFLSVKKSWVEWTFGQCVHSNVGRCVKAIVTPRCAVSYRLHRCQRLQDGCANLIFGWNNSDGSRNIPCLVSRAPPQNTEK